MDFLKKLFGGVPASPTDVLVFHVRCDRCGEVIESRINLNNDLSMDDEGGYILRKVLMGSGRCFERVEVVLKFNSARQLQEKQIACGVFLD